MIIQSVMIFSLGLFIAALIAIAVAPLVWARASNVTRQQLVATLPLNEFEIRASRDHLRAEHAIKAHRLESKVESAEQVNARQLIEINRRELHIHELNNQIIELKQENTEKNSQNIVLMQNIDRKVPVLEDRASRLMTVLVEREREIEALKRHGIHSFSHDESENDLDDFYYTTNEIEQMRGELGEEVAVNQAPQRTIIENAESIYEENKDLLSKVARLQARVMKLEGRENNETTLLRTEMQNIAMVLMQEQSDVYQSQFHQLPQLTDTSVTPINQLPFEFEFDEKKPVFLEKAEIAAAEKAKNPTSKDDEEEAPPENSLTARLETLLKQK